MKSPLEDQAFRAVTSFSFKKFQDELERASQYSLVHVEGHEFILKHYKSDGRNHRVFWDGNITTCSYKNFEFWGILCRHILRVFIHKDCFQIPSYYLPPCWCSRVPKPSSEESGILLAVEVSQQSIQDNDDSRNRDGILCPPKSKTKGCPRK